MPLALTHSPVDPDEQMLTKHCISRLVSRSDQDRNTKTTAPSVLYIVMDSNCTWDRMNSTLCTLTLGDYLFLKTSTSRVQ